MKQYADLHVHTNLSDGSDSVHEILHLASSNTVSILSLTDHNTLDAYSEEMFNEADTLGIQVIPGVELDVIHKDKQFHLLAYGIDIQNARLREACTYNTAVQEAYNLALLRHMEKDGMAVSEEAYHNYTIPLGRGGWKLLNYLLDTGITRSLLEGTQYYKQYGFDSNTIQFISLNEALSIVKEASGISVLAHPGEQILYDPYAVQNDAFWLTLEDVMTSGIEGIECIHPLHGFDLQKKLIALCSTKNFFISGGTDYHGNFFNKQKQTVGGQLIATDIVKKLVASLKYNNH